MKPVAQRDLTRPSTRRQALRDNRRLVCITPATPPRRSRQNLHPTKAVPINWQIIWHTIPRAHHAGQHHTVVTGRKVGVRLRLRFNYPPHVTLAVGDTVDPDVLVDTPIVSQPFLGNP